MSHDVLSDLLRCVRLRGAVFYHVSCRDEWCAEAPAAREIAPAVMPGAGHVMEYHMVAKGQGWAATQGVAPARLAAGDVVMFPHGDAHVMSSAPGLKPQRMEAGWVFATRREPKPMPIAYHHGTMRPGAETPAGEADTALICGFLSCDLKPFNPLIAALPKLLHLPAPRIGAWVGRVIEQAVVESDARRPGGDAVLERLSEMMFIDAVRAYLDGLPEEATGWLAGLRDRHVGRALALLHEQPEFAWSVDELGRRIGLSRSALHERFMALLGQPPMQYLAQWRMQVAASLLRGGRANVADIALQVGYESEAAFARAFKRLVGTPPAAWRRKQAGEA
jgi:AraC-like DNA-binding protein